VIKRAAQRLTDVLRCTGPANLLKACLYETLLIALPSNPCFFKRSMAFARGELFTALEPRARSFLSTPAQRAN